MSKGDSRVAPGRARTARLVSATRFARVKSSSWTQGDKFPEMQEDTVGLLRPTAVLLTTRTICPGSYQELVQSTHPGGKWALRLLRRPSRIQQESERRRYKVSEHDDTD